MAIQQKTASAFGGINPQAGSPYPAAAPWQIRNNAPAPQRQFGLGDFLSNAQASSEQARVNPVIPHQSYFGVAPGAGAWQNVVDEFLPQQQPAAQGFPQQQVAPQPAQITTGITQPQEIQQPQPGQTPNLPSWLGNAGQQAVQGNLSRFLEPLQAEAMGNYYTGTSGLQDSFQQAQAQAGLGWGGLAQKMFGLQGQRQGNLLNFLSGLA